MEEEGWEGERRREKYKASSDNNRERRKRTTEKRRRDSTSRSGNATDELDWTTARGRCWWTDGFLFCWFNEEPRSHGSWLEAVVLTSVGSFFLVVNFIQRNKCS